MSQVEVEQEGRAGLLVCAGWLMTGLTVAVFTLTVVFSSTSDFRGQDNPASAANALETFSSREDQAHTSQYPPAVPPKIVACIVSSESAARKMEAGLDHMHAKSSMARLAPNQTLILVAETAEEAEASKTSLLVSAFEDVYIEVHDLTLE